MALLAGFGSSIGNLGQHAGAEAGGKDKVLDASEEEMIKSKEKKDSEDSSWDWQNKLYSHYRAKKTKGNAIVFGS